jgi:hypothetical protein
MDVSNLLRIIKNGVEFAEQLAPVISMIPGAGPLLNTAVKAAGAVTEIAQNLQDRVNEGAIVMSSQDATELDGLIARLADINDDLAARIDES